MTRRNLVDKVGTAITHAQDIHSALAEIVHTVTAGLEMEVCSIYSYSGDSRRLVLLATHGLGPRSVGFVSMGVDEGLTGYVIEKNEPVMAIDALAHPRYKYFPETGEERYHSFLGVPIVDRGEPVGVLVVQTSRRRRFTQAEIRILKMVAVPISGLMARLSLHQKIETQEAERQGYQRRLQEMIQHVRTLDSGRTKDSAKKISPGTRLTGLAAAPGFGTGRAFLLSPEANVAPFPEHRSGSEKKEIARYQDAIKCSLRQVDQLKGRLQRSVPEFDTRILDAHRTMLEDPALTRSVTDAIVAGASAEHAVRSSVQTMVAAFEKISDSYMQERAIDVKEIGQRILRNLVGDLGRNEKISAAVVVVAPEISIYDMMQFDRRNLKGIAIATGGTTSHGAILAKSLEIPMVVGLSALTSVVEEGDLIIVDGNAGTVYVNPSPDVRREYQRLTTELRAFSRELDSLRELPATTRDGYTITLNANIGLLGDLSLAKRYGADGVGLYRTEFAFLTHRDFLTENEQFELYTRVVREMEAKSVTIRTLDLGADKYPPYLHFPHEANPFLGWRSTRISLDMPDVFKAQLRAILRASVLGPVRIMFPMISSVDEIRAVKEHLAHACEELRSTGVPFVPNISIGIMVEVPAAVLMADVLIREVDFFSIGTNDLIQYLLAVDRDNARVAHYYASLHPAVLRAIGTTVRAATAAGKHVSICGEMASDPVCTLVLVGLGLRSLSMSAFFIPVIKRLIRSVDLSTAERLADRVLELGTVEEVKGCVIGELRRLGLVDLLEAAH